MTASFLDLLERLAAFSDAQMEEPWTWPGHQGEVLSLRYVHWHIHQAESLALATAPPPASEAAVAMDTAQAAFGDLRGLIAGQPDGLLDAAPEGGGWTLREVLAHVLVVDARYRRQVEYATTRAEADPVYLQQPFEVDPGEAERGGSRAWLERLARERAAFDALGRALPTEALLLPTRWAGHVVDVRFRLHRAAAHLAEHTIHAEKVLRALGRPPTEARQATRRISALRGEHEFRTPAAELERLDRAHLELLA